MRRTVSCARALFSSPRIRRANVSSFSSLVRTRPLSKLFSPLWSLVYAECPEGCQRCSDSSACEACAPINGAYAFFDESTTQCASGCTGEGCAKHAPQYTFNPLDDSDRCQQGYTYSAKYLTCLKLARNCGEDKLSLSSQQGANAAAGGASTFTYFLGAPEWSYTPKISHSENSCAMTCQLSEGGKEADWDVITNFDENTGSFSLFTRDAYVYNREDLYMRVTCTSEDSNSVVTDDVTIKIRRDLSKKQKRSRRALQSIP